MIKDVGNHKGKRWYSTHVPVADSLYSVHLDTLKNEGYFDGKEIQ